MSVLHYDEFGFELSYNQHDIIYYTVNILDKTKFYYYKYILLSIDNWKYFHKFRNDNTGDSCGYLFTADKLPILNKNADILKRKMKLNKILGLTTDIKI